MTIQINHAIQFTILISFENMPSTKISYPKKRLMSFIPLSSYVVMGDNSTRL